MLHELPASLPVQVHLLRFARVRGWSRAARRVVWALALALVVLLLQSLFWEDQAPLVLKIGVATVAILAALRPADALLVVAGLVPFGHVLVTSVWSIHPLALSEALVLAFFSGYLWRSRRAVIDPTLPPDSLVLPSRLFALVVLASCLVQLAVLQVWHDYPLAYATDFLYFLGREYLTSVPDQRPWVDGRRFVSTAALLLEGVALVLCARTLCGEQPALARRLTRVIVTVGVGTAILSFFELTAVGLSFNEPLTSFIDTGRWSFAIPSVNTAGSYFMLVAFIAIGTAVASSPRLLPGLLAGVITLGGMWLTKTRSAIVAGLAIVAAGVVWWVATGLRGWSPLRAVLVAALAALAAVAVSVYVMVYDPFDVLAARGNRSLYMRALFAETGLRMLATEPLVGVGIGQYALRFPEFASPELLQSYARNDAHNYFLWVAAELGLIGLAIFLWLLGAALVRAWSRLRERPTDPWFFGIVAGTGAFLLTWFGGQPLAIPQVAYTFWIVLGLAVGLAGSQAPAWRPAQPFLKWMALGLIVFVLGSVPVRARLAIDEIDLSRVTYGLYDWETNSTGVRYRWTGPRATFFERSSVREIEIPIAARAGVAPQGFGVDILVDGHALKRVMLADGAWHSVRIAAPNSKRRFWRVDLHVSPTWVPRVVLPDSSDARELGVLVGEIDVRRLQ